MKKWRRIMAVLLAVCLVIPVAACQKKGDGTVGEKQNETEQMEGSMGRFVESDVTLPEGRIYFLEGITDGSVRILTENGVFDSKDEGASWQTWEKQPAELLDDLNAPPEAIPGSTVAGISGLNSAVIRTDGAFFYNLRQDGKWIYKFIDKDGNSSVIPIQLDEENMGIFGMRFTDAGDLLACTDMSGNIIQIDCVSGTVKHTYESGAGEVIGGYSTSTFLTAIGDTLYAVFNTPQIGEDGLNIRNNIEVKSYSLTTYEEQETNQALEDFLKGGAGSQKQNYRPVLMDGKDGKSFYIANDSGIYRYTQEGSVIEKIYNGSLGQMNCSSCESGMIADEDNLFLMYSDDSDHLVKYTFDSNVPTTPEHELTVYSLYDDAKIRTAITKFQKGNPDIYVTYDVGITGNDGMTTSDAIKNLNTNIMAGEGPDVLFLEGMPIDSYQEKGALADLSDVIKEVSEAEGLFDNIASAYEKDGKILAVPTGFSVPVVAGKQDSIEQVTDLNKFVELAQIQKDSGVSSIFQKMDSYWVLKTFLPASSPAWIQENGSLDEDALREFLTAIKELTELNQIPQSKRSGMEADGSLEFELSQFMTTGELNSIEMLRKNADLSVFHMKDNWNLFRVTSAMKQMGDDYAYAPAPGQASNVFIPLETVGISAKSENTEVAKRFVKYLIGADSILENGWPVNKKAFENGMEKPENAGEGEAQVVTGEEGIQVNINYIWPSKEDYQTFEDMAAALDTPCVTDEIINKTVLEEGAKALQGKNTVEEAVDAIMSKLNIYLSE